MSRTRFTLTRPHDVRNAWGIWAVIIAGICVVSIATGFTRSVTGAYAAGADRWLESTDLYREGIHGFLYLPQAALLYLPFDQLPQWLGGSLWRIGSMALFAWGLYRFSRCMSRLSGVELFPLVTLLAILPSLAAFRNGQMTVPMTGCLLLAGAGLADSRWWWTVFWLCLAVAMKPLAIVLLLLAIVLEPALWWRLPLGICCMLLVPFGFQSPEFVVDTYGRFVQKLGVAGTPGFDTSYSDVFGTIRVFDVDAPESLKTMLRGLAAFGTLLASWASMKRFGRLGGTIFMVLLALTYILLFNPRTENNTYVIIAPVIATTAAGCFLVGRWKFAGAMLTMAMLLIAANYELTKHVTPGRETWLCPLLTLVIGLWLAGLIWIRTCPWIPEGTKSESSGISTAAQPDGEPG